MTRMRFSIRTLLVAVTLIAVFCGVGVYVRDYPKRQAHLFFERIQEGEFELAEAMLTAPMHNYPWYGWSDEQRRQAKLTFLIDHAKPKRGGALFEIDVPSIGNQRGGSYLYFSRFDGIKVHFGFAD